MSVETMTKARPIRETVSETEWQTRVELAACYRLMAHDGISDLTHNHLTARVPDESDAFLIKPGDFMFDEVTASSLIKYDFAGAPRQDGGPKLRGGGLVIHAGLFKVRHDLNAIFHTHTPANMGVASQKQGLLPINQHAMHFYGRLIYHDFGGFEFNLDMCAPLVRDLGREKFALLRNHGSLVCGETIGEAFVEHHFLEMACRGQVAALAGGSEVVLIDRAVCEFAAKQVVESASRTSGGKDWVACLRQAERLYPSHRD